MHRQLVNGSIGQDRTWTDSDGLTYTEAWRQEYGGNDCIFSAGRVEGHAIDTIYFLLEKQGHLDALFLLRPDEATALAIALMGAVWCQQMESA